VSAIGGRYHGQQPNPVSQIRDAGARDDSPEEEALLAHAEEPGAGRRRDADRRPADFKAASF
jgi:hypothetical protein